MRVAAPLHNRRQEAHTSAPGHLRTSCEHCAGSIAGSFSRTLYTLLGEACKLPAAKLNTGSTFVLVPQPHKLPCIITAL